MSFATFLGATTPKLFPGLPIYNEDTPDTPGLYLGLMHGRHTPDEHLDDWGFNGPIIGPLEFVHTTYATHVRFQFADEAAERRYRRLTGDALSSDTLTIMHDMLVFAGKYFGDWCVFHHS